MPLLLLSTHLGKGYLHSLAPEPAEGQVKPEELREPYCAQGTQQHRRPAEYERQPVAPFEASFTTIQIVPGSCGGLREAGSPLAKCTEVLGCWQGWLT